MCGFNSRPREGATRLQASAKIILIMFQLTPPRGGDLPGALGPQSKRSFNSRPREGATRGELRIEALGPVSTHAPARGRPNLHHWIDGANLVSTHAPARGRQGYHVASPSWWRFQLTPPRGGDTSSGRKGRRAVSFNSRPREGATSHDMDGDRDAAVSTHAPARGRPRLASGRGPKCDVSTHAPARGRPGSRPHPGRRRCFNSRPREGATPPLSTR